MSGIINFNAQIAPLEHVEKLVRQEQEHGQTKQAAVMQNAAESLHQDNKQVQESAKSANSRKVKARGEKEAPEQQSGNDSEQQGESQSGQAEPKDSGASAPADLWSGNIVNLKV